MGAMGTAHAQLAPIDRSDRRAQRQQMMQGMTPEQRAQYFQNQRQQRRNAATPEQRARMDASRVNGQNNGNGNGAAGAGNATGFGTAGQRNPMGGGGGNRTRNRTGGSNGAAATTPASQEARMRAMMNAAGITDKAQQDPIVAFVFAQTEARTPLLKTAQRVANSLSDGVSTPEQISVNWTEYQGALETDKTRFAKELAALDEKIGYSKNPRLKSFLSLVGVLSPDASVLGEVDNIFVNPLQTRTAATSRTQNG